MSGKKPDVRTKGRVEWHGEVAASLAYITRENGEKELGVAILFE